LRDKIKFRYKMKQIYQLIVRPTHVFINNKLFIKVSNQNYIRVKQKLPEFIEDVTELKKYDYHFKK